MVYLFSIWNLPSLEEMVEKRMSRNDTSPGAPVHSTNLVWTTINHSEVFAVTRRLSQ